MQNKKELCHLKRTAEFNISLPFPRESAHVSAPIKSWKRQATSLDKTVGTTRVLGSVPKSRGLHREAPPAALGGLAVDVCSLQRAEQVRTCLEAPTVPTAHGEDPKSHGSGKVSVRKPSLTLSGLPALGEVHVHGALLSRRIPAHAQDKVQRVPAAGTEAHTLTSQTPCGRPQGRARGSWGRLTWGKWTRASRV